MIEYSPLELKALEKKIVRDDNGLFSPTKSPNAIIVVYDLAKALDSYEQGLPEEVYHAKIAMTAEFIKHLTEYIDDSKADGQKENALKKFKLACQGTVQTHYKSLASEPSIWNAIKDIFNDVCKFLGLGSKATLDASAIGKNPGVEAHFDNIEKEQIKASDVEEVEHTRTITPRP